MPNPRPRLRQIRKEKGVSAQVAATKAGISVSMWLMVEQGERNPSINVIRKMAEALDVTPDEIFLALIAQAATLDPAVGGGA